MGILGRSNKHMTKEQSTLPPKTPLARPEPLRLGHPFKSSTNGTDQALALGANSEKQKMYPISLQENTLLDDLLSSLDSPSATSTPFIHPRSSLISQTDTMDSISEESSISHPSDQDTQQSTAPPSEARSTLVKSNTTISHRDAKYKPQPAFSRKSSSIVDSDVSDSEFSASTASSGSMTTRSRSNASIHSEAKGVRPMRPDNGPPLSTMLMSRMKERHRQECRRSWQSPLLEKRAMLRQSSSSMMAASAPPGRISVTPANTCPLSLPLSPPPTRLPDRSHPSLIRSVSAQPEGLSAPRNSFPGVCSTGYPYLSSPPIPYGPGLIVPSPMSMMPLHSSVYPPAPVQMQLPMHPELTQNYRQRNSPQVPGRKAQGQTPSIPQGITSENAKCGPTTHSTTPPTPLTPLTPLTSLTPPYTSEMKAESASNATSAAIPNSMWTNSNVFTPPTTPLASPQYPSPSPTMPYFAFHTPSTNFPDSQPFNLPTFAQTGSNERSRSASVPNLSRLHAQNTPRSGTETSPSTNTSTNGSLLNTHSPITFPSAYPLGWPGMTMLVLPQVAQNGAPPFSFVVPNLAYPSNFQPPFVHHPLDYQLQQQQQHCNSYPAPACHMNCASGHAPDAAMHTQSHCHSSISDNHTGCCPDPRCRCTPAEAPSRLPKSVSSVSCASTQERGKCSSRQQSCSPCSHYDHMRPMCQYHTTGCTSRHTKCAPHRASAIPVYSKSKGLKPSLPSP